MTMDQNKTGSRFLHAVIPFPGDAPFDWARKIVAILSVCAILASGGTLLFRAVRPQARQGEAPVQAQADPVLSALKTKYPGATPPEGMQEKFGRLYAVNNDVVGWLTIPHTRTDTPVMQATRAQGANDYYLRYNYYHEYTRYGDPFMDYRNNSRELSRNTILYGHNLQGDPIDNGMCFTGMMDYHTLEGYQKAPVITFNTLYQDYQWKVFGAFVTTTKAKDDNGYVFNYIYPDIKDEKFMPYVEEVRARSLYTTDVDVRPDDKVLTLSTCTYELGTSVDARFVVVARLVREGESEEVDVSKAKANPNPHYPQAWYDRNGRTNPYRNAERWYPF